MSQYKRHYNFGQIVFITIVVNNRKAILPDNIQLIRDSFKSVKYKFTIIAGIILKDHLHILIQPENMDEIPKIVTFFKYNFSKNYSGTCDKLESHIKRREKGIWQRRYYDHIIRDEKDFNRHLDYIHYNSIKHYNIAPRDWEYSSFGKFVKDGFYEEDWCNFEDRNGIAMLDLE